MQDAEEYERELDLETCQRTKQNGFFFGWHNLEFSAMLPANRLLFYAPVPMFRNEIEIFRLLHVPYPPFFGVLYRCSAWS